MRATRVDCDNRARHGETSQTISIVVFWEALVEAAYCGIVGFKATYGRVSNRGTVPVAWTLDHVGPLCRTVEDAAMMLSAIAGYDELDPTSVDMPVPNYGLASRMQLSKLRLGIPRVPFFDGLDPEVDRATAGAIEVLGRLAAEVRDLTSPIVAAPLLEIGLAWLVPSLTHTTRNRLPSLLTNISQRHVAASSHRQTRACRVRTPAEMNASTYLEARRQLDLLRREIRNVFANVHLLIMPTAPSPPVTVAQGADPTIVSIHNTAPFDVLGLPALSLPCGFTTAGLPIGLQIVGAPFAESTVLALAHAYEQATEWHRRSPPM